MRTLYRHEIAEELFGTILGDAIEKTVGILTALERVKAVRSHCGGMLWDVADKATLAKWIATAGY